MDNIKPISQPQFSKLDDYTLQVISQPITPEPITTTYDRTFIENQLVAIQAQLDDYTAARQAELDNCQSILDQMDAQGIVSKPDPIIDPTPVAPLSTDTAIAS